MPDPLVLAHVYPDLLGTYGDEGNVLTLRHRAEARGIAVTVVEVQVGETLPEHADLYVLGGGEDAAQVLAGRSLARAPRAAAVLGRGRPVLAVCAGLQLLAVSYSDGEARRPGLGVIDATCDRLPERAVGEVVTEPDRLPDVPTLTGFENHRGTAVLGPQARPLGRLLAGVGNGDGSTEGVLQGPVVATYLHGPVLVRNPALADHLLATAVGAPLAAYDHEAAEALRRERLEAGDPHHRHVGRH